MSGSGAYTRNGARQTAVTSDHPSERRGATPADRWPDQAPHASRWSVLVVALLFLLLSLGLTAVGCGGEDTNTDTTAVGTSPGETSETAATAASEEAARLGIDLDAALSDNPLR